MPERLIQVAAQAKVWVCSRWLAVIVVLIPPVAWMSVMSVVCCQVEAFPKGRSLTQRSTTTCGVSKVGIVRGYFTCYSTASSVAI